LRTRELERYKSILVEERERLRIALERRGVSIQRDVGGESGENVYSDHMADMALQETEGARHALLSSLEWKLLKEVERALSRIRKGTFGTCMSCGKAIEKERLNIVPYARHCAGCESEAKN
jgi:RNA polymerase-binding transcription factor DksA